MALEYDKRIKYGELDIVTAQGEKRHIGIYKANALCCAMSVATDGKGENYNRLEFFFGDERHIKNIDKNPMGFFSGMQDMSLNLYYKESRVMLPYFCKNGVEVRCYWEIPEPVERPKIKIG